MWNSVQSSIFILRIFLYLLVLIPLANAHAANSDLQQDRASILKMAGCYEVTFQFAETFALQPNYQYHDRYKTGGLEWIFVDEDAEEAISLQHLLLAGPSIIKHWRQQWLYENRDLWTFFPSGDTQSWNYSEVPLASNPGSWTQKVFQVDDSPRYECSAPWIHVPAGSYWECQADAPLPRREFSTRKDYNLLRRQNRHQITASGHMHIEDNIKVQKDESGSETPLVMEKGLNTYRKVNDDKCRPAKEWWQQHQGYWKNVQMVWQDLFAQRKNLVMPKNSSGQQLWEELFKLDEFYATHPTTDGDMQEKVRDSILKYLHLE